MQTGRDGILIPHRVSKDHGVCVAMYCPFCWCATNTKLCPPCRVTASTGTTAMGFVLQITRALIICALRTRSGGRCTGAFTRMPCKVLSTWGEMKSILVFSSSLPPVS